MIYDLFSYLPMFSAFFWLIILLITRDEEDFAKIMLGITMLLAFLLDFSMSIFYQQQYDFYAYIDPLNSFCAISIFLIFYWYIKLLTTEPTIKKHNLWLLFPGVFFSLISIILYQLMSDAERTNYIHNFIFRYGELRNITPLVRLKIINFIIIKVVFVSTVVFSIIKCRILVKKYNKKISNYYSNLTHRSINWVNKAIVSFIFIGIISILVNTFNQPHLLQSKLMFISSVFFSSILFIIGYMGNQQNFNISNLEFSDALPSFEENNDSPVIYKTREEQQAIINNLNLLFKEKKIHLIPDLKITDLAKKLNTNRTYISRIINTEYNSSFIEYVNQYRIKEAKSRLRADTTTSINDISLLSGFNTASTFTRVFKQYVGDSPSNFRKKYLIQKESKEKLLS